MFPTRLNFLPPEKRRYLRRMVFTQFVKSTMEMLVLLLSITGMALLATQWVLQGYFNDLTENIVASANQQASSNQQIKHVNMVLRQADTIQAEHKLWSPLLTRLAHAVPEGVVLTSLSVNASEDLLSLAGTATTREALLNLQQSLEELPEIEMISIPLSQLTQPTNISFSFQAQIDL